MIYKYVVFWILAVAWMTSPGPRVDDYGVVHLEDDRRYIKEYHYMERPHMRTFMDRDSALAFLYAAPQPDSLILYGNYILYIHLDSIPITGVPWRHDGRED